MQRILVGTGTTATADLDAAADPATTHGSELLVLHVPGGR